MPDTQYIIFQFLVLNLSTFDVCRLILRRLLLVLVVVVVIVVNVGMMMFEPEECHFSKRCCS